MQDFTLRLSFGDILVDDLVNNGIGRFVYKGFVKTISFRGDEKVLEFGCGTGSLSRHIIKNLTHGGSLTGIDISKYQIERAEKRLQNYKNVKVIEGNITDNIFEADSFDIAIIHYVLHHVEKAKRQDTINEIYRLLKSGGKIYIKEPKRSNDGMPSDEIKELMKNAGFVETEEENTEKFFRGAFKK